MLGFLASCSLLREPAPGNARRVAGAGEAEGVLRKSVATMGDAWHRYDTVTVGYEGKWKWLAKKVQPTLTDPKFRKSSVEKYDISREMVLQEHRGPSGDKRVVRNRKGVEVRYLDALSTDPDSKAAAALVADAYTAFLFGPSWLLENGRDLEQVGSRKVDGERCDGVQGRLTPGFGFSNEDRFVAWVGQESGLLRRLQFTLEGLESTRGADVDVTFKDHWTARDGSRWPSLFVERVRRPIPIKAHVWRMTSLKVDGTKFR